MQPESDLHASQLTALSPLDGRYRSKLSTLTSYFSESALIHARVRVEITYLQHFLEATQVAQLTPAQNSQLEQVATTFSLADATRVKELEATTHHDVKAVEYFLKEKCEAVGLEHLARYIHFGITSEDTNNLAYRVLLTGANHNVVLPALRKLLSKIASLATEHRALPMLARTHGQPAIPTTLGKEYSVFGARLLKQLQQLEALQLHGKLNGAVGGYQALALTFPSVQWQAVSEKNVRTLGLTQSPNTTQIAAPEDILELLGIYQRINGILLDLSSDMWRYISDDWLVQKGKNTHVGSSTMPQKVNPIEFENAEGNLTLANGMIDVFCRKLPQSRLQRDLSESTIVRNYGVVFGHTLLGITSLHKGLETVAPSHAEIQAALHKNWNILSEALQVVTRAEGDTHGYEHAAAAFKQTLVTKELWQKTVAPHDSPEQKLTNLTPESYLGYSVAITQQTVKDITKYLEGVADEKPASTIHSCL